ncbi:MAG: type II secretion system protein F [bacterium]|nr:type II secretion system protein F [bacterium]MCM1374698.1 hypothetical protein [Muribaculum sp.]
MIISLRPQGCGSGFSLRENVTDLGRGMLVTALFAFFFYRSVWALLPMLPVGWLYMRRNRRVRRRRKDRELLVQFKECLLAVAASMRAGYAVENAFTDSITDMRRMFGEGSAMEQELRLVRQGLSNNVPLEALLAEMGRRSGLGEMGEFAEVFAIAKRNGGSIPEMIAAASGSISRRLEVEEEMETLLAARKLEQQVMNAMPFMIVWYVEVSNPGYFDMLYGNLTGVVLMTGCLGVYLAAYALSEMIFRRTFTL